MITKPTTHERGAQAPPSLEQVQLRPYQREAIDAVRTSFANGARRVLVVLPVGAGKTTVFSEIARLTAARGGRALVLAHRSELLDQAAARVRAVAPDLRVELERAGDRAGLAADVVVASVQTLSRGPRLARWDRDAFRLVVIDEAHHAAADSYRRIVAHFKSHVLGVTATPDRGDGRALGEVFDAVAYERSMLEMVRDGYLAPISARTVRVEGFDLSRAMVRGGDFAEGDVAAALGEDGVLEAIASPLIEQSAGRSTLVFVAGVERAHELAAILNRDAGPDAAAAIDGSTPRDMRAAVLDRFARGDLRFVVNVGIATEGTDVPRCSCVAIARPTKSRALFVQMAGRGVRLAPGKADCLLLNFIPTNARHRLVGPVDALAPGDMTDAERERARELADANPDLPLEEALELAAAEAPQLARDRLAKSYRYTIESWDPFAAVAPFLDLQLALDVDERGEASAGAEMEALARAGVPQDVVRRTSPGLARAVVRALEERRRAGLCSLKVARQLVRRGLNPNVSSELGREAMQALDAAGWRTVPKSLREDPRFALPAPASANPGGAA